MAVGYTSCAWFFFGGESQEHNTKNMDLKKIKIKIKSGKEVVKRL